MTTGWYIIYNMAEYKNVNLISRSRKGFVTIATQNKYGRGTGYTRKMRLKKLMDKFYRK